MHDLQVRIDRSDAPSSDALGRGKRSIVLDLKTQAATLVALCKTADVLIDPYRPGVLEKLRLGPEVLCEVNPRLIFARLTGFGQSGEYKSNAGHDINYLALSGALGMSAPAGGGTPVFPCNMLADFAGGGMSCVLGILLALHHRGQSGRGQVVDASMVDGAQVDTDGDGAVWMHRWWTVDASMVDGCAYLSSFIHKMREQGNWSLPAGQNILDGGAYFYGCYQTKDGRYMAVGSFEPKFHEILVTKLDARHLFPTEKQMDTATWPQKRNQMQAIFSTKTRTEWEQIFQGSDACVTPVLAAHEVSSFKHNMERGMMASAFDVSPAPKLLLTPGRPSSLTNPVCGEHTEEVLHEAGLLSSKIPHRTSVLEAKL
ncbi:hypothetical protein CYMTET_28313 [Cymbomonas tetramitiformis]|uniref:Alpha-methylacyl-CoA racemase n=1 Tax=Cymbomonas tetramitiformis TaxID=36881 RepID=A0AAE0FN39_9CHLO|nr:hypothetical protein CYMTET_28313 [Cymbomonas tetramitiformis]